MAWTVETLSAAVDAELEALPADMRVRFSYITRLIEEFGLDRVREPHVKHLQGPLWEMCMKGKDGRGHSTSRQRASAWWWCVSSSRRPERRQNVRWIWP